MFWTTLRATPAWKPTIKAQMKPKTRCTVPKKSQMNHFVWLAKISIVMHVARMHCHVNVINANTLDILITNLTA